MATVAADDPLAPFGDATRTWFRQSFAEPTEVQRRGWPASRAASTRSCSRPPAAARRSPRSCTASTGWPARPLTPPRPMARASMASPAQGARLRRRAQPPRAARQAAAARRRRRDHRRRPHRRHDPGRARERQAQAPRSTSSSPRRSRCTSLLTPSQSRERLCSGSSRSIVDEIHAVARDQARGPPAPHARAARAPRRRHDPSAAPLQRIGLSATQRPLVEVARAVCGGGPAGRRPPTRVRSRPGLVIDRAGARPGRQGPPTRPRPGRARGAWRPRPAGARAEHVREDSREVGGGRPARRGSRPGTSAGRAAQSAVAARSCPRLVERDARAHRSTMIFVQLAAARRARRAVAGRAGAWQPTIARRHRDRAARTTGRWRATSGR